MKRLLMAIAVVSLFAFTGIAAAQHDAESDDHLVSPQTPAGQPQRADGTWGDVELLGSVRISDAEDDLNADLTVDFSGKFAFIARWGGSKCAGPEAGGRPDADGGAYVIDISNLSAPKEVGFIPSRQDTQVGEGMQYVNVTTSSFNGPIVAMNHEACGKNGTGGWSLWDVTDPLKAKKLSEAFGDFTLDGDKATPRKPNHAHSVFVWDAGSKAYLVSVDNMEATDVDIFDITDPKKPVLISESNLSVGFDDDPPLDQPALGLVDTFNHDMIVKQVAGQWLMLVSNWDGGWVILNVNDPANPTFVDDYDYQSIDPELLAQTGASEPPEGNAHQAEFSPDNRFIIGTDEDFGPARGQISFEDGLFGAGAGGPAPQLDPGETLTGPTRFVGRACPGDPAPPPPGAPGEIAVVERGLCLFTEKLVEIEAAGDYAGVVIMNREGNDLVNSPCTGVFNPFVEATIPVFFVGRDTGFKIFDLTYNDAACLDATPQPAPIVLGTLGDVVTLSSTFDGWGYVHLLDRTTLNDLDTYAIPEAMDPDFADGFGVLSVHEVAFDPVDWRRAYLSYYSGGLRALRIDCPGATTAGCTLAEIGGFIDPDTDGSGPDPGGNEYWGVETRTIGGRTIVFTSDLDGSLWIFRSRTP